MSSADQAKQAARAAANAAATGNVTVQMNDPVFAPVMGTPSALVHEFASKGMTGAKYKLGDKIAQGGMGAIYKVLDEGLQRVTVLKVILPEVLSNTELFTRFIEEARITGQLEHPNIVPVHDIGVLDDRLYFSMKYIEGEELRTILRRLRARVPAYVAKYNLYTLLTMFRKVCDATAFAHAKGFIHRDIKPDNILIGKFGEVLLVDWGLARAEHRPEPAAPAASGATDSRPAADKSGRDPKEVGETSEAAQRTRDGIIKGTPAYMAPEQAKGQTTKIDHRTDVFLLGATLYAIATLQTPYAGEDIYELLSDAENGRFAPPSERAPERQIPDALNQIILKAMAYEPEDRYQTVEELCQDVDALMEGRIVSVERSFATGEHLMKEGEVGAEAYVITAGEVEVYKIIGNRRVTIVSLKAGDTVGEMALISKTTRSASVVALSDTKVVVITPDVMKQALAKLPPWMTQAVETLVQRLRETNALIHPLARGDCTGQVLSQLRYLFPSCATPSLEPTSGLRVLSMRLDDTIHEIAYTLSLPAGRVAPIFASLLDSGLLVGYGESRFRIPNFNALTDFVDYVRAQGEQRAALTSDRTAAFFASPSQVVCTFSAPGGPGDEEELAEALPAPVEEVLHCASAAEIPLRFQELLDLLRGAKRI